MVSKYPSGKRKKVTPPKVSFTKTKIDPSTKLLEILLLAAPFYVSGSLIADKLQMSRVGVWSRITKLREKGLVIEASQNKGYRIAAEPDRLVQELLEAWQLNKRNKCKVFVHDNIDSTNSEAERLLANDEKTPFAVIANNQSKGRGRRGNRWFSPAKGNIYLSIAFRPRIKIEKIKMFTIWQGIYIANLLKSISSNDNIMVKWPNDLVFEGKKLAGMLTEASIDSDNVRTLIFGFGLNLNICRKEFPRSVFKNSTSLKELTGQNFKINEISAQLIKVILSTYKKGLKEGLEDELNAKWKQNDALFGRKIEVSLGNEKIKGKAVGINSEGRLKIKLSNNRIRLIQSGEVTVSKW